MKTEFPEQSRSKLFALAILSILTATVTPASAQIQVKTEPHGYVKILINPGTGTTKRTTLFSVPLLEETNIDGRSLERITALTSNTITSPSAGWTPGQLSNPEEPYLVEITSGTMKGRTLLLSTTVPNTSDTVTLDTASTESINLTVTGLVADNQVGDTYQIRPVDTLASLFGDVEQTQIKGGHTPSTADTITMVVNGSARTFFYNTSVSPPRWSRVSLGTPDSQNVPILPSAALKYARLPSTPLALIVTGKVPTAGRKVAIKNSGVTLLSTHWPIDQTLSNLGFQNIPSWKPGSTVAEADSIVLISGGNVSTHFYDGSNWRRVSLGSPISNETLIPVSTGTMIIRKGRNPGNSEYTQEPPYQIE